MKHSHIVLGVTTAVLATAMALTGCTTGASTSPSSTGSSGVDPNETYYWVGILSSTATFVQNDQAGAQAAADALGVKFDVSGPTTPDFAAAADAIAQVCAQKPAGVMVPGYSPVYIPAIDKCIEQGVPVITIDSGLPTSKALSFVGTDWSTVGTTLAAQVIKSMPDGGTIGLISNVGVPIQDEAVNSFKDAIKGTKINVVSEQSNKGQGSVESATQVSAMIAANPDIEGIVGFSNDDPQGIATAVKESGKQGAIKAWTVEGVTDESTLGFVKDGSITAVVRQSRALFGYWAMQQLFAYNHSSLQILGSAPKELVSPLPLSITTGFTIIDSSNVDELIAASK